MKLIHTEKRIFYDRKEQKKLLNDKFINLRTGEFGVIYGRRRTGKSELLRQFHNKIKDQDKLFITVTSSTKTEFSRQLSTKIQESFNETVIINNWNDFFDYLINRQNNNNNKTILIIDEFQRLNNFAKDFFFTLQEYWDSKLKHLPFMILICGSSMSMMHQIALEEHGPLYGRKTFELHIKPFRYIDFREMFKEFSEEEKIRIFSIFGGTPKYLEDYKYSNTNDLFEAYEKLVLMDNGPLFEEPLNALKFELKNPGRYISILRSLSDGKIQTPEISQYLGIKNKQLSPYLKTLADLLDIIEDADPLFGKKRNKRYKIKDNFFRFWYKFVCPFREQLEIGNKDHILEKISRDFDSYLGKIFEDIVKEFFILMNNQEIKTKKLNFTKIGKWWELGEDIDLVLDQKNEVIFVEIKFKEKKIGFKVYNDLVRKSKKTSASGKFTYILVSKAGFKQDIINKKPKNLTLLTLNDLEQIWDDQTKHMSPSQELLLKFL